MLRDIPTFKLKSLLKKHFLETQFSFFFLLSQICGLIGTICSLLCHEAYLHGLVHDFVIVFFIQLYFMSICNCGYYQNKCFYSISILLNVSPWRTNMFSQKNNLYNVVLICLCQRGITLCCLTAHEQLCKGNNQQRSLDLCGPILRKEITCTILNRC